MKTWIGQKEFFFYGIWGILIGLIFILLVPALSFIFNKPLYSEKLLLAFIGTVASGALTIWFSLVLIANVKFGKAKYKDPHMRFLVISNLFSLGYGVALLRYKLLWIKFFDTFIYAWIILTIIIPLSSWLYFNLPSVKEYFKQRYLEE